MAGLCLKHPTVWLGIWDRNHQLGHWRKKVTGFVKMLRNLQNRDSKSQKPILASSKKNPGGRLYTCPTQKWASTFDWIYGCARVMITLYMGHNITVVSSWNPAIRDFYLWSYPRFNCDMNNAMLMGVYSIQFPTKGNLQSLKDWVGKKWKNWPQATQLTLCFNRLFKSQGAK